MFAGLDQPIHIVIVLVIVLLLFGAKRIPELARGVGSGVREFKRGVSGEGEEQEPEEKRGVESKKDRPGGEDKPDQK